MLSINHANTFSTLLENLQNLMLNILNRIAIRTENNNMQNL